MLVIAIVASALAPIGVAGAAERPTERGTAASRERTVRLGRSLEGARACSVTSESPIRCFASAEEMAAATGSRAGERPQARAGRTGEQVSAASDCNGTPYYWLYLYEHPNYGGRIVQFNDVNLWQNLGDYGFDNRTSAWWNDTDCFAYLADGAWGGGGLLYMPSLAWQSNMGWWDNRPSSLYIAG